MVAIDYNLMRHLSALLEERSVTRAAERLHVSQPSMSAALARLRGHYDDSLLARRGNDYELTPLGERLLVALPQALAETEQVFRLQSRFNPVTSTRKFLIAGVDYTIARIAPALTRLVAREAPNVRFEFPPADGRLVYGVPDTLRTIDGVILPHGYARGLPHLDFTPEPWVCLVDGASGVGENPTADDILTRPWVETVPVREGATPAANQLRFRGVEVQVVAETPHFFVLPFLLLGTDRVALVPLPFARMAVRTEPRLRIVVPPFELDPVCDAFWWHPDRERDEEHVWLRSVLARVRDVVIGEADNGDMKVGVR